MPKPEPLVFLCWLSNVWINAKMFPCSMNSFIISMRFKMENARFCFLRAQGKHSAPKLLSGTKPFNNSACFWYNSKINMLHHLSCCETRFRLLCRWHLLHRSLSLALRQCKLKSLHFILAQSGNSIIATACPLKSSWKEHNWNTVTLLEERSDKSRSTLSILERVDRLLMSQMGLLIINW